MAQESLCLSMEVLVEAVHKLVNYAFLCETFCPFCTRDRFSCASCLSINVYNGEVKCSLTYQSTLIIFRKQIERALAEHVNFFFSSKDFD